MTSSKLSALRTKSWGGLGGGVGGGGGGMVLGLLGGGGVGGGGGGGGVLVFRIGSYCDLGILSLLTVPAGELRIKKEYWL